MKCGKETAEGQVFCENCLKDMEQYPVKPGTPVYIPNRTQTGQEKKSIRKKDPTKEETIQQQYQLIRLLLMALGALAVVFVMVLVYLLYTLGVLPSIT